MKNKITYYLSLFVIFATITWSYGQSDYPVSLSSPMDFDTIVETEPTLVWQIDVQGITSDPRYSQRLVLCELLENQTKGDAIVLNAPLVLQNDYQNSTYSYNSSTDPLQMGHSYAWQVQILFNGMQVDQSDVFQFTIFEPADTMPKFYPVVFKNDGQTYGIVNGRIGLVTEEKGPLDLSVKIQFGDEIIPNTYINEWKEGELQTETISVEGLQKRFFQLNVDALDLDPGTYAVTWTPKKGKTYVFNFIVE